MQKRHTVKNTDSIASAGCPQCSFCDKNNILNVKSVFWLPIPHHLEEVGLRGLSFCLTELDGRRNSIFKNLSNEEVKGKRRLRRKPGLWKEPAQAGVWKEWVRQLEGFSWDVRSGERHGKRRFWRHFSVCFEAYCLPHFFQFTLWNFSSVYLFNF